ncbi:MAG: NAD(P)-dependent oxidoreductase [Rhodospirillales bacterium]|jgi:3-hydroxyisobutyrate dehydrogenase-like beta-hydroxyacid dehydrogenase|nr:NAD(P)-dependent oxidoreductase [Rhodospirillales bacterium]
MTSLDGKTIGFIGLGLMGRPMSLNLMKAGARLIVHNRSRPVVEEMAAKGMVAADTPGAVAAKAKTVIVMVSDTPATEAVIGGADGILGAVGPDSLIIDMGTTAVSATRRLAAAVVGAGGQYVDAPVSGGTVGAEDGTLTIMAGGPEEAVGRATPVFEVLGASLTHVGAIGTGQVAKAANQVIVGLVIGAVAEALTLARRAGADPAKVRQALKGGFADSRILELHGQRMVSGDFRPGGKATTQRKDLAQALDLAAELGFEMPATLLNRELYDRLIADGFGDLDHSALIKVLDPE